MNRLNERDEKGIKISERLRSNVYPDSEEKLNEDIMSKPQAQEDEAKIVNSENPESQEWPTRENTQEKQTHH